MLLVEIGQGKYKFKVPVYASDLDLEAKAYVKARLAPIVPYVGTVSLAFVGMPNIKVKISPYKIMDIMRIPVLQVS